MKREKGMGLKRVIVVLAALTMIISMLTGCAGKPQIDPVKVVQASLDAELKGEVDEYAKLTGEDKEDVLRQYEELLNTYAVDLSTTMGVRGITDSVYKDIAKKTLASAKYEVKDAQKDEEDNYIVNVDVYPSDLLGALLQASVKKGMENPDLEQMDQFIAEIFDEAIANQNYKEPETCQIRLTHDDEYVYEVSADDMEALGAALFYIPEELSVGSGKDYGNRYLNWLKEDWEAASEEEKTNCCLVIVQKISGITDEQMATLDKADSAVQEGVQMMKSGVDDIYTSRLNMSIGDFVEYMMSMDLTF